MSGKETRRILQVEDHQDTAKVLTIVLQEEGYQVETVDTFEKGIEAIRSRSFDVYLFDNLLSDGNGADLCREVRKRDRETPIIFHSAGGYSSDREQAIEAGANRYLVKPVDLDELLKTVGELLTDPLSKSSKAR